MKAPIRLVQQNPINVVGKSLVFQLGEVAECGWKSANIFLKITIESQESQDQIWYFGGLSWAKPNRLDFEPIEPTILFKFICFDPTNDPEWKFVRNQLQPRTAFPLVPRAPLSSLLGSCVVCKNMHVGTVITPNLHGCGFKA